MKARMLYARLGAVLLAAAIGMLCMAASAFAHEGIDTEREASLEVCFGEGGRGFAGARFSVFRVADVSEDGAYVPTGDFAEYPVDFEIADSSGWRALAQTLSSYTARDGIPPLASEETGQDGRLRIAGLSTGLYLVVGEQYRDGEAVCTPEPMLISLPGQADDGAWLYDVTAACKFDREEGPGAITSVKVQKVWKDGGQGRPREISVQLLENGAVADTVVLNRENNWEYVWDSLDGTSMWRVAEAEVPEGYTVAVAKEGALFVVTNSRPSTPPSKLPQTGMLWWPVPVLAGAGATLVVAGLVVRRRREGRDGE